MSTSNVFQTHQTQNRLLISLQDAAERLGVSYYAVRNWMLDGSLGFPTVKVGSRRLVPVIELEKYVQRLTDEALERLPHPPSPTIPDPAPLKRGRGRPRKVEREA
jgi:excisionase family DNA binding protein